MADAAQIESEELDQFLDADVADQLACARAHLSLAALFHLAQALDRRFKSSPWRIDPAVRRVIRARLDPEPFIALSESAQLAHIETTDPDDLLGLHNSYLAWLEDGDERPISPAVLARLLERIDEEEHSRYAQDAELDAALRPEALALVREQRSIGRVGEMLVLPQDERDAFIRALDYFALDELRAQMEAFSHKHGRSPAWRAAHSLVAALIEKEARR